MDKIIKRIEREIGMPGLTSTLAERLSPTDLQSLLLEVFRQRANKRRPSELLADYKSNRFVQPSVTSPISLVQWEQAAFGRWGLGWLDSKTAQQ